MKKVLLLSAAMLAMSASTFAQQKSLVRTAPLKKATIMKEGKTLQFSTDVRNKRAARRAFADGVYYIPPIGCLYGAIQEDFRSSFFPMIYASPNVSNMFFNLSDDVSSTQWLIGGEAADAEDVYNNHYLFGGEEGYPDAGWYYTPQLTDGTTTYTWAEEAEDVGTTLETESGPITIEPLTVIADTIECMSLNCSSTMPSLLLYANVPEYDSQGKQTGNYVYQGYAYGTTDVSALVGQEAVMNGICQPYDMPNSPFWFDQAYIFISDPLPAGTELSMKIVKFDYDENYNPVIHEDEVIAELKGKAEDAVANEAGVYSLTFKNETTNDYGDKRIDPVVVNEAFAIIIDGFQQPGVNVGLVAADQSDLEAEVGNLNRTLWRLQDKSGNPIDGQIGWVAMNAYIGFHGIFDGAKVVEHETYLYTDGSTVEMENLNYLKIGDDLKSTNMGDNEESYAIVKTVMPWFDSDGNEQYFFELPDWLELTDYEVTEVTDQNSDGTSYVYGYGLAFTATGAVPEGETVNGKPGRYAEVTVEGKGIVSDPIYVLQGDITIDDVKAEIAATGINDVKVNKDQKSTKTYSITGAQVNKDYRGIVIKNGKKLIKK